MEGLGGLLKPDLLYVILFGPGYGESIVLRIPPDHLVVIDSLRQPGNATVKVLPLELLREVGATWSGVILTHPHEDHAAGLSDILSHPGQGFVGCVAPYIDRHELWSRSADAEEIIRKGSVEEALAAIHDRWERRPDERWELKAGTERMVGEARLRALFPDDPALSGFNRASHKPNRLATPVLVEWSDVRLLLGSDLERRGWTCVGRQDHDPPLHKHAALKVPHHGSRMAQHECVLGGDSRGRFWMVSPWNRGRGLPRFEDEEGVDLLLRREEEVHLTALPVKVAITCSGPLQVTRQAIRDCQLPGSQRRKVARGVFLEPIPEPSTAPGAFIAAGFSREGLLRDLHYGDSAVVVRQADTGAK